MKSPRRCATASVAWARPSTSTRVIALDDEVRKLKNESERLKAEQNRLSKEVGKEIGQAAPEAREQVKARAAAATAQLKEQLDALVARLPEAEARFEEKMLELPNLPHPSVPVGKDDSENTVLREEGQKRPFAFAPVPHWDLGDAARHHRLRARREGLGIALLRAQGMGRAAAAGAHHVHARSAHARSTATREIYPPYMVKPASASSAPATCPKFGENALSRRRRGLLVDPDRRGAGHEPLPRRDPGRGAAADLARRLLALLPAREDGGRTRHPRHQARPPVRQGRDGEVRAARDVRRRAAGLARRRRGCLQAARTSRTGSCRCAPAISRSPQR